MKKLAIIFLFILIFCALMTLSVGAYTNVYGEEIEGCTPIERTDWFDFSTYPGVVTDGSADISDLLQACVNEYDNIFLPEGKYRLEKPVEVRDGTGIKGEDGTVISCPGAPGDFVFNCFYKNQTIDEATGLPILAHDISIKNLDVYCDILLYKTHVFYSSGVKNLEIENVNCYGLGLAVVGHYQSEKPYERDAEGRYRQYYSNGITIRNCYIDGLEEIDIMRCTSGITFYVINNFIVEGCEITNFSHGIQFYGGISDIGSDENYENHFLECGNFENGIFVGNKVYFVPGGGIWGTCASNVILRDNDIQYCIDGSIDFEASFDILVEDNYIVNGLVGGSTAAIGEIKYHHNTFIMTQDWERDYFSLRGSPDSDYAKYRQHLIFDDNTFISYGKVGTVNATHYNRAAVAKFTFTNNKCVNTVLRTVTRYIIDSTQDDNTAGLDMWQFDVENNTFDFDVKIPWYHNSAVYCIVGAKSVDGMTVKIVNNKVSTSVDGEIGRIYVSNSLNGDSFKATVANNEADNITLINTSDKPCGLILLGNKADVINVSGKFGYLMKANTKRDGSTVTKSSLLIDTLIRRTVSALSVATEKKITAPSLPEGYEVLTDGDTDTVWNGCEEQKLETRSGSDANVSLKMLWSAYAGEKPYIAALVNIDKKAEITKNDALELWFENGGEALSLYFKLVIGTGGNIDVSIYDCLINYVVTLGSDNTTATVEMKIFPGEGTLLYNALTAYNGSDIPLGFNFTFFENAQSDKSVSWACKASDNSDTSKLGTVVFAGDMKREADERTAEADFNGDGVIDSRDLILMKQYLANGAYKTNASGADKANITDATVYVIKAVVAGIDMLRNAIFGIA